MQRFLIRRFFLMIVTLFAVSMIIFVMARVGGDPRSLLLDDHATKEQWELLGEELGLDKPLYYQYAIFMSGVLRGNFGESISLRRPVMEVISERNLPTVQLGGAAFLLALLVGIPLECCPQSREAPSLTSLEELSPSSARRLPHSGWALCSFSGSPWGWDSCRRPGARTGTASSFQRLLWPGAGSWQEVCASCAPQCLTLWTRNT